MEDRVHDSGESDQDSPFAISESLVPPREQKTAGTTNIDFDGLLSEPLVLQEDLKEGCGGQLWPAGIVLSKYMLRRHHSDLRGKTMSVCSIPTLFHCKCGFFICRLSLQ